MAYATQQDIINLYGMEYLLLAADRDGAGEPEEAVVTGGISAATNEIDSYLSSKYDLPLADTPPHLTKICVDMALYHMSPGAASLTDEKRTRYDDAVKWLMAVAKGTIHLGIADPPASLGGGPRIVPVSSTGRRFSRDSMRGL